MNKITKQDRKLIARVAKSLPRMQNSKETVTRIIHGAAILGHNPNATLGASHESVKANKHYVGGEQQKEVNHRKELEKMFVKFGETGIATYQKQILQAATA